MTKSSQSKIHEAMNTHDGSVLTGCRWIVRYEECHADIVTFLPGRKERWAVENERRANAYWICRNAFRNHKNGASGIVFVAETNVLAEKIRRIIGGLPDAVRNKTLVVCIDDFTAEFVHNKMEGRSRHI